MPPTDPLNRGPADELHLVLRGAISAVPVVGGPLVELFNRIIAEPVQKRRDVVFHSILERLHDLETKHLLDVEQLAKRPEFHACLLRGIQAALREIETDKIKIIEDAVINTALDPNLEPTIRAMMFNALERVTTEHIKLLRMVAGAASDSHSKHVWPERVIAKDLTEYDHPEQCVKPMSMLVVEGATERFVDEREIELRRAILDDLVREGLLKAGVDYSPETAFSQSQQSPFVEVTVLGDSFLKFVEDPEELSEHLQHRATSRGPFSSDPANSSPGEKDPSPRQG